MKILVACEWSGTVSQAFRAKGHQVTSCDLVPSLFQPHLQCDVREILYNNWDLVIAHPPCTRLANSAYHHVIRYRLWREFFDAVHFFNLFRDLPRCAIENPIPSPIALNFIGRYDQLTRFSFFGDRSNKAVCLWLNDVPPLISSKYHPEPADVITQLGSKGKKERTRFCPGIAQAMAEQWS